MWNINDIPQNSSAGLSLGIAKILRYVFLIFLHGTKRLWF